MTNPSIERTNYEKDLDEVFLKYIDHETLTTISQPYLDPSPQNNLNEPNRDLIFAIRAIQDTPEIPITIKNPIRDSPVNFEI